VHVQSLHFRALPFVATPPYRERCPADAEQCADEFLNLIGSSGFSNVVFKTGCIRDDIVVPAFPQCVQVRLARHTPVDNDHRLAFICNYPFKIGDRIEQRPAFADVSRKDLMADNKTKLGPSRTPFSCSMESMATAVDVSASDCATSCQGDCDGPRASSILSSTRSKQNHCAPMSWKRRHQSANPAGVCVYFCI
jgi:hypothetical protein